MTVSDSYAITTTAVHVLKIENRKSKMRESGQALVPVLFVVFILTAFAVTIAATARQETRAASNHLRERQQQYIALGAIRYGMAALQQATNGGAKE